MTLNEIRALQRLADVPRGIAKTLMLAHGFTDELIAGDVVVVCKLDRFGRSTRELLDLIHRIDKAGASFRSLGDPLWDTGSAQGRLLLTVLAAIAEFEPELIREPTGEGRKRAMAKGVKFGRKVKLSAFQRAEVLRCR